VAQPRHAFRQQQEREREQHELHTDEQQERPHDVHGLRPWYANAASATATLAMLLAAAIAIVRVSAVG
jgi:hypothetical protein